jgi:Arc/MetJ family transcription regulator
VCSKRAPRPAASCRSTTALWSSPLAAAIHAGLIESVGSPRRLQPGRCTGRAVAVPAPSGQEPENSPSDKVVRVRDRKITEHRLGLVHQPGMEQCQAPSGRDLRNVGHLQRSRFIPFDGAAQNPRCRVRVAVDPEFLAHRLEQGAQVRIPEGRQRPPRSHQRLHFSQLAQGPPDSGPPGASRCSWPPEAWPRPRPCGPGGRGCERRGRGVCLCRGDGGVPTVRPSSSSSPDGTGLSCGGGGLPGSSARVLHALSSGASPLRPGGAGPLQDEGEVERTPSGGLALFLPCPRPTPPQIVPGKEVTSIALQYVSNGHIYMHIRTTLNLDDTLFEEAQRLTGLKEKRAVVHEGLRALIAREKSRRLARLGGSEPRLEPVPRRRSRRQA